MLSATNAIVLSKIKYRDNDLIVKCYTQQYGIVSYLLRGILKSKKGAVKTAHFQLLSQLHLNCVHKEARSLQAIKDAKLRHSYNSVHTNVLKSSITMFLAEVLSSILKEEEPNEDLYSYLETALLWLDNHDEYSNFHILFLIKLKQHLGIYPDVSEIKHNYFNLSSGKFELENTGKYCITGENLILLKQFLGTTFDALSSIKVNSKQRQSLLNIILLYFELHLGLFKKPKSLQILNQVFN